MSLSYIGVGYEAASFSAAAQVVSTSGTLHNLYVKISADAAPSVSNQWFFSVYVNGVGVSIGCLVTAGQTSSTSAGTASISAGDQVAILAAPTGAPPATTATWSLDIS